LIDPLNDNTRYVGISNDIYTRFSQNIRGEGNNHPKNRWIQELKEYQVMVIMQSLEYVETLEEAKDREEYWIHYYLKQGASLFNQYIPKLFSYDDFLSAMGKKGETVYYDEIENEDTVLSEQEEVTQWQKSKRYFMAFAEASEYTGYAISTLRKQLKSGEIEANKNGDKLKVSTLRIRTGHTAQMPAIQVEQVPATNGLH
jgi:predicted GIY-YIG superfamily endonuclease